MLTWIEVDSKAIKFNLKQFRKFIGSEVLLMPVIKANAYGHGLIGVAKICQESKEVDRICVVNLDESLELLKSHIKKPIMVLSFFDTTDEKKISEAIKNGVIFPLYSQKMAKILNRIGERVNKKINVHLKIDTGTTRIGILPEEVEKFIKGLKKFKYLVIEGVWSHFASSEEDPAYTKNQHESFKLACKNLSEQGIDPKIKHIACSAATISYSYAHENAMRLGLSLYGLYPDKQSRNRIELKPALSWHTKIIQVKTVPTGTKVGYGGTFKTNRPSKIAIIPIGYWDGYDRRLSNKAYVLIKGSRCQVVGRICMNLSMIDVTNLDVDEGEKVTIIGKNGNEYIGVDNLAQWSETINYEIVDRINSSLPRIYR